MLVDALHDLTQDIYEKREGLDVYYNSIFVTIPKIQIQNTCD